MSSTLEIFIASLLLAASGVLLAATKVRGSAVLLHHGTHGRLYRNTTLNRWAAEAVGIIALAIGFDEYRRIHGLHHGYNTFAQPEGDEEAAGLLADGLRPGRSLQDLKRNLMVTLISPAWHARQAWARLKANFFAGPPLRRLAAWGFWGGIGTWAAMGGWMTGFFGAVALLLTAGSLGSYLELTSRHIWNVTPDSQGRERQLELSHWRLPTPSVPDRWTPGSTLRFIGSVAVKALWRIAVTPVDLTHHAAHHLAWDAGPQQDRPPAWTDAAQAYSDRLRAAPNLHKHVFGSLSEPLNASFEALAKAPPLKPGAAPAPTPR